MEREMGEASELSKIVLRPTQIDLRIDEYIQSIADNVENFRIKSKIDHYCKKKTFLIPGFLAILAYKAVGGGDPERIFHGSRGVSLLGLSASAFDDLFDDFIEKGVVDRGVENSVTMCSGVIFLTHSITEIMRACEGCTKEKRRAILKAVENCTISACDGFQIQIKNRGRIDIDYKEYIDFLRKSSGEFGKLGSKVGALLGGGVNGEVDVLGEFGMNILSAIQVYDDAYEARESAKHGFYTPPILHAIKWSETVKRALNNPPVDDVILDTIMDEKNIKKAKKNFEEVIVKFLDDTNENLKRIRECEAKDLMLELVRLIQTRKLYL